MAIVGFFETSLYAGTINASYSFSAQQNFGSALNIWSRPYLQQVSNNDDDGSVELWVSQFKDNKGTHNGKWQPGIYANNCTSVTFGMATTDCVARAVLTTEIFG